MPPFRLLHAAGLDPEAFLPEPPPGLNEIFAAAPLAAIERLVTRAIELQVDCLLVTPAVPIAGLPDGPGLSREADLRQQFGRLTDEGIPLLIAAGARGTGWERFADRNSKIVVLSPGSFAPLTDRHGSPSAVLRCVEQPTLANRPLPSGANDTLELAVVPRLSADALRDVSMLRHDYLALGAGPRATAALAAGHAHCPGPLQAVGPSETGAHGATLVTIDEGGVTTGFVPTATVRFESVSVQSEAADQLDDLAVRMTEHLEEFHSEPGEQAWVVCWRIEATGALFDLLDAPHGRAEAAGLLPETVGGVPVFHKLTVVPHPLWPALNDPLAAEFAAALQEQSESLTDPSQRLALLALPDNVPRRSRLARLIAAAEPAAVLGDARRFGLRLATAATAGDTDDCPLP